MGGPNREQLLKLAVNSAKQGNKDGARVMLRQILDEDKRNETALLWMAKVARTPDERQVYLESVLDVNPDNELARKALDKLESRSSASESQKLVVYGSAALGAFLLLTLIMTAFWAFAPLS